MKVRSFAKINIGLRVLGKRRDGYHELETLFQQISLCDEIFFEPTQDGQVMLECYDPACPVDESNLIIRAAQRLQPFAAVPNAGCRIVLNKRIPMGGGLGGGSSNAAAALKTLNGLWQCGLSYEQLSEHAAALGSDTAFFLLGGLALGQGRGERLTPLPYKPSYTGVLLIPNFSVSTKSVYERLNLTLTITAKMPKFICFGNAFPPFEEWKVHFPNDLESIVFRDRPILAEWVSRFYSTGAFYASMSGSGSSVFGLFSDRRQAARSAADFKHEARTVIFRPIYR